MNQLANLRTDIDHIDEQLISLLAQRKAVVEEIGKYKKEHNLPIVDLERFQALVAERMQSGNEQWLSEEYIRNIWEIIHEEAVRQQG